MVEEVSLVAWCLRCRSMEGQADLPPEIGMVAYDLQDCRVVSSVCLCVWHVLGVVSLLELCIWRVVVSRIRKVNHKHHQRSRG